MLTRMHSDVKMHPSRFDSLEARTCKTPKKVIFPGAFAKEVYYLYNKEAKKNTG